MTQRSNVLPPVRRITEEDARKALSFGLLRLTSEHGPSRVGLEAGCDEKTIRNARDQKSTLRLDLAVNLLTLDPTALDELFGEMGFRLTPRYTDAANDMTLATSLSGALAEFLRRLADGERCPKDTGIMAALFRQLIPQMQAIVDEDDARRSRAAA